MKAKKIIKIGAYCLLGWLIVISCFNLSDAVFAKKGPKPSTEEESAGNNLSFPVIWAEVTLPLRGEPLTPTLLGASYTDANGVDWYYQQDTQNEWQAESFTPTYTLDVPSIIVAEIDWGDNLEAKAWYETSVVRVETVLYQTLVEPMTGYTMSYIYGEGPDEMWGTNGETYYSDEATIYSGCARLTIQKLSKEPNDVTLNLTWNPTRGEWEGDVEATIHNSGVWQHVEGPTSPDYYSAEVNVAGKVIYGYNWHVRKTVLTSGDIPGYYRITFSLYDKYAVAEVYREDAPDLKTYFEEGTTVIRVTEETVETLSEDGDEGPGGGGVAVIDYENNLTYIDVLILPKPQGGGNSNQHGGNGNRRGGN